MEKQKRDILVSVLAEYGSAVKVGGWQAGEPIIEANKNIPDIEKWAMAMRLMIRADELLQEKKRSK